MKLTEQIGLLENCTGYNDDPSGPFGLSRGGLVRNLRPAPPSLDHPSAPLEETLLEFSKDGESWETFRVFNHSLRTGDVGRIRAELFAPKPVPEPPAGSSRFVWCYHLGEGLFHYALGNRPEVCSSPSWVPTRWHSCYAFDESGQFLGYFSPCYPDRGWRVPEAFAGDWSSDTVMDSLASARLTLALAGKPL